MVLFAFSILVRFSTSLILSRVLFSMINPLWFLFNLSLLMISFRLCTIEVLKSLMIVGSRVIGLVLSMFGLFVLSLLIKIIFPLIKCLGTSHFCNHILNVFSIFVINGEFISVLNTPPGMLSNLGALYQGMLSTDLFSSYL